MKSEKKIYKVLIADDNADIHRDFQKILTSSQAKDELEKEESQFFEELNNKLEQPQYEISSAYQGEEALEFIKKGIQEGNPYAVAFIDVKMPPGWDGIETISRIWEVDLAVQTVICTAFSDYTWEDIFKKFGQTDRLLILKKPFDNIEVRQFVSTLAKKWSLANQVAEQLNILQKLVHRRTIKLHRSLSLLRATFEATADGILVTNAEDKITDYNQKFVDLWGVPKSILDSRKLQNLLGFFIGKLEQPDILLNQIQISKNDCRAETIDLLKLQDNKTYECYTHPQSINGEVIGRVWSFRDITKRKELEVLLAYQATHDVLTGLPNRAFFVKKLEEKITEAKNHQNICAVLFFDLDHFKLINDSLGHTAGDQLLIAVAKRLTSCTKAEDTLARLGGDEFAATITNLSDENDIYYIIDRYLRVFRQPFNIEGRHLNITMSAGISVYPKNGENGEVLFKNADAAMYRAKEMGRNNFQFYTASMNLHSSDRLELANDLQNAINNNEFILLYHPLLNLEQNKIVGVEALIRWRHPKRGLLSPVEFIPIAEENRLIVNIGRWALQTACEQVYRWHTKKLGKLWVAVNISPTQFKQDDIVMTVSNILEKTKLPPQYLCLEITENILLEDDVALHKSLIKLKELGVILAIDDFGVGYSNLNYISKFPFDVLKIDKSFVHNLTSNINDASVIIAILGIAKSLNMKVLAEGVETIEQLNFLRQNQCKEFQGFLFSKPIDAISCENIIKNPEKYLRNLHISQD